MKMRDKAVNAFLCSVIIVVGLVSFVYAESAADVLETHQQQYKFIKGDVIPYDVSYITVDGETKQYALLLEVSSIDEYNTAVFRAIAGAVSRQRILFPPPEECTDPYMWSLKALSHMREYRPLFIRIAEKGEIKSFIGPSETDFKYYGTGPLPSRINYWVFWIESKIFASYPFLIFPGRDLKKGDTWHAKIDLPMKLYGKIEIEQNKDFEFTFLGFEEYDNEKVAKIKVNSKGNWVRMEDDQFSNINKSSSEGMIYFSLMRRIPVYYYLTTEMDFKPYYESIDYKKSKTNRKIELKLLDATHIKKVLSDIEKRGAPCKD